MPFEISPSPRARRSPFFDATVADGVRSFSPYNHMLMPTGFGDPAAEYWRLVSGVVMWDVAVERQIEVAGPDAGRLAQILTPRKLAAMRPGMGWYVAICNHRGVIINDPILLKLAEDRYWFSISDSDLALFARAVAAERGLDVQVFEPDVSPLAIQGPKAEDVVASLLGEGIRAIKFFRFIEMQLDGVPLIVARSGWSRQGGFELYLLDGSRGTDLWNRVKAAGAPFGIGPGCPNPIERIESGLLSYRGDTDGDTNPFEVRMEKYIHLDVSDDVIGIKALRDIHAAGPARRQVGLRLDMDGELPYLDRPSTILLDNNVIGAVTAHCYSPRLEKNIGMGLVPHRIESGTQVEVRLADGRHCGGMICELPFI